MAYHNFVELRQLIADDRWHLATSRCQRDLLSLGLTSLQAGRLLGRLRGNDYKGEFGPCDTDFGRVQGDYFLIWIDPDTATRCQPNQGTKIYIKLAIGQVMGSTACLVVSFHTALR